VQLSSEDVIAIMLLAFTYTGIYLDKIKWGDATSIIYVILIFYFGSKAFGVVYNLARKLHGATHE